MNYLDKSWETRRRKFPLSGFEFDTIAPHINFKLGRWTGSLQYRLYYYSETGRTTQFPHHAWVGYNFPGGDTLKAGFTKVPFGILPFASNNYFFSLAYYVGLEDDYDVGLSYERHSGPWRFDVAYFQTDEGSFVGRSHDSARYSYDVVDEGKAGNTERNQVNARAEYTLQPAKKTTVKIGLSAEYGRIPNKFTHRAGRHYAVAGHIDIGHGPWSLKLEAAHFGYRLKNPAGQSRDIVTMGAYDFSYQTPASGTLYIIGLARHWAINWGIIKNLTVYNDYSLLDKGPAGYRTSQQNVTGFSLDFKGPLLLYVDIAQGKHDAWIGPDFTRALGPGDPTGWNQRFNVNLGLYF